MNDINQLIQTTYDDLKNPDGSINNEKLKELVKKYVELQNNSEQVYDKVTNGLLKGSHYSAEVVISVFETTQKDLIDKNSVCDDMLHMVGKDEGTKQLILEYFGKLY